MRPGFADASQARFLAELHCRNAQAQDPDFDDFDAEGCSVGSPASKPRETTSAPGAKARATIFGAHLEATPVLTGFDPTSSTCCLLHPVGSRSERTTTPVSLHHIVQSSRNPWRGVAVSASIPTGPSSTARAAINELHKHGLASSFRGLAAAGPRRSAVGRGCRPAGHGLPCRNALCRPAPQAASDSPSSAITSASRPGSEQASSAPEKPSWPPVSSRVRGTRPSGASPEPISATSGR